jgi:hypothetical protein
MPCQVRVLFAYWRGKFGNPPVEWSSLEDDSTMLNVVHLERKKWLNFEDREKTVVELKAFFLNSLFHLMAAYDSFRISSFHAFFDIFSFSGYVFSCIRPLCTW